MKRCGIDIWQYQSMNLPSAGAATTGRKGRAGGKEERRKLVKENSNRMSEGENDKIARIV
jgi:hypothetical protein